VIALNFEKKLILIGGTEYAGENKKSVFTLLNYLLPGKGVMPMHCSANHARRSRRHRRLLRPVGHRQDDARPMPDRTLIGDDEHGWSDRGTFNFEGGCYAKTINLREERPSRRSSRPRRNFGTVIENMVYDPETLELDFDDDSLTANTRCAYPLELDPERLGNGLAGIRRTS
jgi:phosphoenolpyruvate carboxykinase (ATP)